jgi:hypothetical protein
MVIDACTESAGSWYRAVVEEDRTARADFIVYSPLAVCLPYDSLGSCAALSRPILQQCRKAGPIPPSIITACDERTRDGCTKPSTASYITLKRSLSPTLYKYSAQSVLACSGSNV